MNSPQGLAIRPETEKDETTTTEVFPWIADKAYAPEGYTLDESGVFKISDGNDESPTRQKISGPVWVRALTRDLQNGGWGINVSWMDMDGNIHKRSIPRNRFHERGPALAQEFALDGLDIVPGKELALSAYLGSAGSNTSNRMQSVPRLGWLDDPTGRMAFVTPNEVLTKTGGEPCVFQPEKHSPTSETIRAEGTLKEWQDNVAGPCVGNPFLIFGLCVSLAGPLLKPARMDGGGFNLYGMSSHGKTTTAQIAASVWGCGADPAEAPGLAFIRRWNTTVNALEGLAAAHNDTLLVLDELGTASSRDFDKAIYNLAGGLGKAAMDRDRQLKAQRTWRILFLSTGEISAKQKIESEGKTARAGQLLRLMDIPTSSEIIKKTHGMDPAAFVNKIKRSCGQYFGTAGKSFVEKLLDDEDINTLYKTIQSGIDLCLPRITPKESTPEQDRAIRRFALIEVAGLMAVRFGILPFIEQDIRNSTETILNAWLDGSQYLADTDRGVESVEEFILKHESRFRKANDNTHTVRELVGYRNDDYYLFTKEGFKEACSGHDPQDVARKLKSLGFLFTSDNSLMSKHTIFGVGRPRLYAVKIWMIDQE
jgi:uncharacterized protein (DUF927 family)